MVSEISYGGRVTDFMDRRCIKSIIGVYFTSEALQDGYPYSTNGLYHSGHAKDVGGYLRYVEGLPYHDEPEVRPSNEG